jgi:hypothetical protein
MKRLFLGLGIALGALIIIAISVAGWRWWKSLHPKLPAGWPPGSVWVEAPTLRFKILAVGGWAGCFLDTQRSIDRCEFADYKGKLLYQDDYSTCDGRAAIPSNRLWLRPGHQSTAFVFLRDGTILFPTSFCDIRNGVPFKK